MKTSAPTTVAYVLGRFPLLSETFILNEVRGLLRRELELDVISTSAPPGEAEILHETGLLMRSKITYVRGWSDVAGAVGFVAARHPLVLARLTAFNTELPALPTTPKYKRWLRAVFVANHLLRRPARHLHTHWTTPTDIGLLVSRALDISFSFSAHAHDIYDEDPIYEKARPGWGLKRKVEAARFVATCTEFNRRHLRSLCSPAAAENVYTVYHGVDVERFAPLEPPACRSVPVILAVGRLVAYKSFDVLVRSFVRLREAGHPFKGLIVGRGSQEGALRRQIESGGLTREVELLGAQPLERMPELYRRADIFVSTARLARGQHGLPNVLFEAMSSGLAVVATDLPPVKELIHHGVNGLVVENTDDAVYHAIVSLIRDPEKRRLYGARARARIESRFDAERGLDELTRLFAERGGTGSEGTER